MHILYTLYLFKCLKSCKQFLYKWFYFNLIFYFLQVILEQMTLKYGGLVALIK